MFLSKECFALVSEAKPQAGTVRLREQAYREEIFNIPGEKGRMDLDVCWMPPDRQLLRSALKKYRLSFVGDDNGGCFVESIRVFSDSDRDTIFLNAAFFDSNVLRAARDLYIDVKAAITDNQLIKLKAHVMRIRSPYLSAWSINKLILQWLEGQRRITFLSIQALKTLPRREVLQNIDPSIIITGAEASDGRGYSPDLYILIRSNHGDLILYLDTDYCNLFDPFQVGN
ncbi:hypothetical protein NECAME_02227 [Necator americanus]|uniref:Uncharacterized protein n=1 Tax=Necator americanus TaxID=51031 RepID=W2THW6_NECAM|nr:hypothetical protein NECAME_02227 [Necator americanus]ETN81184.1 hypothetical protein NECAME_02227 [Necator americanus]